VNSPVELRDPIQTHKLMSLNFKNIAAYKPGSLSAVNKHNFDLIKHFVHIAVDTVVPGLGKKEKAEAVHNISQVVHKLGSYTKKAVVKAAKHVLGDPASFLSINHLSQRTNNMSLSGRNNRAGNGKHTASENTIGGYAIGGVTTAPVAISRNINRQSKPKMRLRGDSILVTHSEMLGAINSGSPTSNVTAFRCVGYRANPGMANIFPWLSSMAVNYEKYRFTSLSFTLVPLVSTVYNGRIGVGFDFDSSDAAPGNRQEFYALSTHCENMPWQGCTVRVKCDNIFRFTGTHVAADNKLIDLGQVIVMSDSISNGATISAALPLYDLIVDYTVELIEPQQALFATQLYSTTASLVSGVPLGTGVDLTGVYGPTVATGTTVTNSVVTFNLPAGVFLVSYHFNWTTGTAATAVTVPTTGAGLKNNNTNTGSDTIGMALVSSPVECSLVFTASGTAWNANLFRFMVGISRVTTQVYSQYFT